VWMMKMEPIECSETSAFKIQKPENYPEDNILYPLHGESLKITILWTLRAPPERLIRRVSGVYERQTRR
jgi:hypothetical protein